VTDFPANTDYLLHLADEVCDEQASADDLSKLDAILLADNISRRCYLKYCQMHTALGLELRAQSAVQKLYRQIDFDPVAIDPQLPSCVAAPLPSVVSTSLPAPTFFSTTPQGTVGFFSSDWSLAYLVATLIFGIGLLIGSVVYVSHPTQVARDSSPSAVAPKIEFVGRITGMVGCKWTGIAVDSPQVPLGRRYDLASGLMEITYNTGAKVILQGPVKYEVDVNGGYLAVGKLTGKLEKEVAGGRGLVAGKSEISNPESRPPNPFVIRTPSAIVTDLGTEFGVEVNQDGESMTHVFAGKVKMVRTGAKDGGEGAQILRAGQTAHCSRHEAIVVSVPSEPMKRFVRSLGFDAASAMQIVEKFDGERLGLNFEQMPSDCYSIGAGAAVFKQPLATAGKQSRGYIRTTTTDFGNRDFIFDATVDIRLNASHKADGTHFVFLGIGDGLPNKKFYDDVSTGFVMGLNLDTGQACVRLCRPDADANGKMDTYNKTYAVMSPLDELPSGRYRLRMWKIGNWMSFAIDTHCRGDFHATYDSRAFALPTVAPLLNATNSRLFVGTGNCDTMTVRFEDLSITYSDVLRKDKSTGAVTGPVPASGAPTGNDGPRPDK
jgi:hypothetical protein